VGYNQGMKNLLAKAMFMINMALVTVIVLGILDNLLSPAAREIYNILNFAGSITLSQLMRRIIATDREPITLAISLSAVVWAMSYLDPYTKTRLSRLRSIVNGG